jgi:hypothetical protein
MEHENIDLKQLFADDPEQAERRLDRAMIGSADEVRLDRIEAVALGEEAIVGGVGQALRDDPELATELAAIKARIAAGELSTEAPKLRQAGPSPSLGIEPELG